MFYGLSFLCIGSAYGNFTQETQVDELQSEGYHRLLTIFNKNRYGYNTRFMSDFDLFLISMMNEKWLDDSTLYYGDKLTGKEIE